MIVRVKVSSVRSVCSDTIRHWLVLALPSDRMHDSTDYPLIWATQLVSHAGRYPREKDLATKSSSSIDNAGIREAVSEPWVRDRMHKTVFAGSGVR